MLLWLVLGCRGDKTQDTAEINLSESLSETEVRAGMIANSSALFGGVAAEGRIGDFKIYNNKVQFIIQANRESAYYIQQGGGILDADIIREEGALGRDIIDEHTPMAGFGRILDPDTIEVLDDGQSGSATIRVTGTGTPFELLQGAVENGNMVPDLQMTYQVDYRLQPDSYMLEVTTTISWMDEAHTFQPANVILLGREVIDWWNPGGGYFGDSNLSWYGASTKGNELALGLFPSTPTFSSSVIQPLLSDATPAMSGFDEMITLENGMTHEFTHYVGVGPDMASLTDEWYSQQGVATQLLEGVVTSGGDVMEGADVHIFDGDSVLTKALSSEDGTWSATVPSDLDVTYQVSGRGHAEIFDLPENSGWVGPYADPNVMQDVYDGFLATGQVSYVEGYGVAEFNTDVLPAIGWVDITLTSHQTGVVHVDWLGEDDRLGSEQVPGKPDGHDALGYLRDGDLRIQLAPGEYRILIHHGPECEYVEATVTVTEGEATELETGIECLELPEGVWSIDPHSHSSASGDGRITMAQRILTHAGHGIDIHVSTEHDHVVDFQPLINALGLSEEISTVVGAEVSPPLRGHHNAYPLTPDAEALNLGAIPWWSSWSTTANLHDSIRSMLPENGIMQANHPVGSSGLFSAANYSTAEGTIGRADFWSTNFDAMELINDASYQDYLPYYFDLTSRGHKITAVSVSDSHGHSNGVGENRTYVHSVSRETSDIMDGMKIQETVPSAGPYIHATINGEWAPGRTFSGAVTLNVEIYNPSWMDVDTIELYENGIVIESIPYTEGTLSFELSPSNDAHYSVSASGTFPMLPLYSSSPWAITSALYVDVAGDGWTPVLPPLE